MGKTRRTIQAKLRLNPGFTVSKDQPILSIDLGLEDLSDRTRVSTNNTEIVEEQTGNIDDSCNRVPVACLDEQLACDDLHDHREGNSAGEPM